MSQHYLISSLLTQLLQLDQLLCSDLLCDWSNLPVKLFCKIAQLTQLINVYGMELKSPL